ncbi:MAG TPA: hypothetical protein VNU49_07585 [Opitutaceae bacterium]|jgi:hypothetical protein|nr:hypothetical protein [Opitutaceae bacterium]
MPSPDDRLQELRRQRALVQEQLAFLDREIAAASGQAKTAMPAPQIPPPVSAAPSQPVAPPAVGDEVDEVIKSLEEESRANPASARSGCIWIFVAGLALFALCLAAFYLYVSHHPSPPVR